MGRHRYGSFSSDWYPTDPDKFMDALCRSQIQRIQRDIGRRAKQYQQRVTEQYGTHVIEHKGITQNTGTGAHGGWRTTMTRERGLDRT